MQTVIIFKYFSLQKALGTILDFEKILSLINKKIHDFLIFYDFCFCLKNMIFVDVLSITCYRKTKNGQKTWFCNVDLVKLIFY